MSAGPSGRTLTVLDPGVLALVQDAGRPGHLAVGVGRSGAADRAAYRLGNRLVGNLDGAAAVEVTMGGLRARASGDLLVCVTGAVVPADADGRRVGHAAPFVLRHGEQLTLGMATAGLRGYLAVRGGVGAEPVLGSRSTDTMSGLGPPPLRAGTVLPVGADAGAWAGVDVAPLPVPPVGEVLLEVTPGPRAGWFAEPDVLTSTTWTVSERSDRSGVRLRGSGARLARTEEHRDVELPSEGMVRGAIQVPPDGEPVVLLADHPVTGGYPVVAVVRPADVDRAAQLVPGQPVRLRRAPSRGAPRP